MAEPKIEIMVEYHSSWGGFQVTNFSRLLLTATFHSLCGISQSINRFFFLFSHCVLTLHSAVVFLSSVSFLLVYSFLSCSFRFSILPPSFLVFFSCVGLVSFSHSFRSLSAPKRLVKQHILEQSWRKILWGTVYLWPWLVLTDSRRISLFGKESKGICSGNIPICKVPPCKPSLPTCKKRWKRFWLAKSRVSLLCHIRIRNIDNLRTWVKKKREILKTTRQHRPDDPAR